MLPHNIDEAVLNKENLHIYHILITLQKEEVRDLQKPGKYYRDRARSHLKGKICPCTKYFTGHNLYYCIYGYGKDQSHEMDPALLEYDA